MNTNTRLEGVDPYTNFTVFRSEHHGVLKSLTAFKQQKDYDCGVYSTAFFIFLLGEETVDFCDIGACLNPDPTVGTYGNRVFLYLQNRLSFHKVFIPTRRGWATLTAPCMVAFQFEGESHYGVVTHKTDTSISIFEPYHASVVCYQKDDFMKAWDSRLNGKRWMIGVR